MTEATVLRKRESWSDEDISRLQELCTQGSTYAECAKAMGRSYASIQIKANRLGLSNNVPLGGPRGLAGPRTPNRHAAARALDVGTAAELIVCADLILAGHRAFMSSAGYAYDVAADIEGQLLRVGVKGVSRPVARSMREANRLCYQFSINRSGKNNTQPSGRYTKRDCDVFALVALDIRQVIYLAPRGEIFPTAFHVDPPSSERGRPARNGIVRKHWNDFSLERALGEIVQ